MSDGLNAYTNNQNVAVIRNPFGIGISGWVFDVGTEQTVTLESDITDHVTENNEFINDHIVRQPQRIELKGFVGELSFLLFRARSQSLLVGEDITSSLGSLNDLNNSLEQVDAYLGSFTPQAVQDAQTVISAVDAAFSRIEQQINRARNLVGTLRGQVGVPSLPPIPGTAPIQTDRQTQAFADLKALWLTNQAVTVSTPWEFFPSMIIENVTAIQDETTGLWSEISVRLKEFRVSQVQIVDFENNVDAPANEIQSAAPTDTGVSQTEDLDELDPARNIPLGQAISGFFGF